MPNGEALGNWRLLTGHANSSEPWNLTWICPYHYLRLGDLGHDLKDMHLTHASEMSREEQSLEHTEIQPDLETAVPSFSLQLQVLVCPVDVTKPRTLKPVVPNLDKLQSV
jgi:hypothetical protein